MTCECGDTTGDVSVHTILQSEIVNNRYAKCLGCKQRLDLNKDMALIGGMNSLVTKMLKNKQLLYDKVLNIKYVSTIKVNNVD